MSFKEFDLIDYIRSRQSTTPFVRLAAGDDLAILAPAGRDAKPKDDLLLVGADQILEGRHFISPPATPALIGRKAMNRNLSDCAAMGCIPTAALVTLALPHTYTFDQAKELYDGIAQAGAEYYCPIVGGDTASWSGPLAVSVSILARSAGLHPVRRDAAQPKDGIWLTGPLGGSWIPPHPSNSPQQLTPGSGRHLSFQPRVSWGRQLARFAPTGHPAVTSMIDLSDGLSRDIHHLLRNGQLGAVIDSDAIPIHPDAVALSALTGQSPLHHALHDGEDYELLYTCPVRPPIGTRIGTITATPGVFLKQSDGSLQPLTQLAWQHHFGQ